MKNLNDILKKLLEEKNLSHTSAFRKKALQMLGEVNPYDLYKKLYNNKDVENGKLLFKIFPNMFYDGEFRKDIIRDKHVKKESDIKFLTKNYLTFMKETGVLEDKNELNHILIHNKVISRNSRGSSLTCFLNPFVNLSLEFNVNFSIMCMRVNEYTLPPAYNRKLLSDMNFNSLGGNSWSDYQNILISNSNVLNDNYESKFKNFYDNSGKNYNNIDNVFFILENKKLTSSFKEAVLKLFSSESMNFQNYNYFFKNPHGRLKEKINTISNLLDIGFSKDEIFDKVKLVKIRDDESIENIKKIIELGFDVNDRITGENKSEYHFWFEELTNKMCSSPEISNAKEIMYYAIENGLDLLSPIDDKNPDINIIEYVTNKSDNIYYKEKNKKEIEKLIEHSLMIKVEKEKDIILNNLKESSPTSIPSKKRI